MAEIAFMVFGLGFFIFTVLMVQRSERELYNRRLMEAREFGFGGQNQHTVKTLRGR